MTPKLDNWRATREKKVGLRLENTLKHEKVNHLASKFVEMKQKWNTKNFWAKEAGIQLLVSFSLSSGAPHFMNKMQVKYNHSHVCLCTISKLSTFTGSSFSKSSLFFFGFITIEAHFKPIAESSPNNYCRQGLIVALSLFITCPCQ